MKSTCMIFVVCCVMLINVAASSSLKNQNSVEAITSNSVNTFLVNSDFYDSWVKLGASTFKDAEFPVSPIVCVENSHSKMRISNPQGQINMSNRATNSQLASSLGFGGGIGGSWNVFSVSASANYLHETIDNEYKMNFTYLQTITGEATLDIGYGEEDVLNKNGKLALADGVNAFQKACGDSFVSGAQAGVVFSVNLQVVFKSAVEKHKFEAAMDADIGGIGNIKAKLENARDQSKVSGNIVISAIQMGGNPENLAKIFNKKSEGGYYASTCSMDNLDDCNQIINGSLDYAQVLGSQIKTASGEFDYGKFYYGFPKLTLYETLGIKVPKASLDFANVNNLLDLVKNISSEHTIINHFLPLIPNRSIVADEFLDALHDQLDKLHNRNKYLNSVATICFAIDKTSAECKKAIEETLNLFDSDTHYSVNSEAIKDLKYAWRYQNPIDSLTLFHDMIFQPLSFGDLTQKLFFGIDHLHDTTHKLYVYSTGIGRNQLAGKTLMDNNPFFDQCDFGYKNKDEYGYQHGKCINAQKDSFFARIQRIENPRM